MVDNEKVDTVGAEVEDKKGPGRQKSEGPTIASVANAAILDGKCNVEVLALILEQFPKAQTKAASVNWYRDKIRQEHPEVETSRAITKRRTDARKATEKAEKDEAKKVAKAEKAEAAKVEKAEKAKASKAKKAKKADGPTDPTA